MISVKNNLLPHGIGRCGCHDMGPLLWAAAGGGKAQAMNL